MNYYFYKRWGQVYFQWEDSTESKESLIIGDTDLINFWDIDLLYIREEEDINYLEHQEELV